MTSVMGALCCCGGGESGPAVILTALRADFYNRLFYDTWTYGYPSASGDPPCPPVPVTESCDPDCISLFNEVFDTPVGCSQPVMVELSIGSRTTALYDAWSSGIRVPYIDTVSESQSVPAYLPPVGGGTPEIVAYGTGTSAVDRFYKVTTIRPPVDTGIDEDGDGSDDAICTYMTGDPVPWDVLVRFVPRPLWSELPVALSVNSAGANRTLKLVGTTLTLKVGTFSYTTTIVGKTMLQIKNYLNTHSSGGLTAVLPTTAMEPHLAVDILLPFPETPIPVIGYLNLYMQGYTLGDEVAGDDYCSRWQIRQSPAPTGPDALAGGVTYYWTQFSGSELEFGLGIAADWSSLPRPEVLGGAGSFPFFFPALSSPAFMPVGGAYVDADCIDPGGGYASVAWTPFVTECLSYACRTSSFSQRQGYHQAWSLERVY